MRSPSGLKLAALPAVPYSMGAIPDVIIPPSRRPAPLEPAWAFGPDASTREGSSATKRTVFVASVLAFVGLVGIVLLGLPSLFTGWFGGGAGHMHRVHEIGWGAFAGLILTVGALMQLRAPERNVAAMQQLMLGLAAGGISIVASGAISRAHVILGLALSVPATVMLATHPARRELLRPGRFSPLVAGLAVAAAVPLIRFAYVQTQIQRTDPITPHGREFHWGTMATMAVAICLVALLSSMRTRGSRVAAWSAGGAAAMYGLASATFPTFASSVGRTWGIGAVVIAMMFVGVAEREARSRRVD